MNIQVKYCDYQYYAWFSLISCICVICKGPPPIFPFSGASCDAICDVKILSRGFASRCAKSEYIPLESN